MNSTLMVVDSTVFPLYSHIATEGERVLEFLWVFSFPCVFFILNALTLVNLVFNQAKYKVLNTSEIVAVCLHVTIMQLWIVQSIVTASWRYVKYNKLGVSHAAELPSVIDPAIVSIYIYGPLGMIHIIAFRMVGGSAVWVVGFFIQNLFGEIRDGQIDISLLLSLYLILQQIVVLSTIRNRVHKRVTLLGNTPLPPSIITTPTTAAVTPGVIIVTDVVSPIQIPREDATAV